MEVFLLKGFQEKGFQEKVVILTYLTYLLICFHMIGTMAWSYNSVFLPSDQNTPK